MPVFDLGKLFFDIIRLFLGGHIPPRLHLQYATTQWRHTFMASFRKVWQSLFFEYF